MFLVATLHHLTSDFFCSPACKLHLLVHFFSLNEFVNILMVIIILSLFCVQPFFRAHSFKVENFFLFQARISWHEAWIADHLISNSMEHIFSEHAINNILIGWTNNRIEIFNVSYLIELTFMDGFLYWISDCMQFNEIYFQYSFYVKMKNKEKNEHVMQRRKNRPNVISRMFFMIVVAVV